MFVDLVPFAHILCSNSQELKIEDLQEGDNLIAMYTSNSSMYIAVVYNAYKQGRLVILKLIDRYSNVTLPRTVHLAKGKTFALHRFLQFAADEGVKVLMHPRAVLNDNYFIQGAMDFKDYIKIPIKNVDMVPPKDNKFKYLHILRKYKNIFTYSTNMESFEDLYKSNKNPLIGWLEANKMEVVHQSDVKELCKKLKDNKELNDVYQKLKKFNLENEAFYKYDEDDEYDVDAALKFINDTKKVANKNRKRSSRN
ncbi:hypothetical protein PvNV_065 [Penaeus vannamei nudivirus]|nr:hypothetical protein PvSNPV_065 [Penaeus vannamei nucleopolyhedrovirus]